MAFLFAFAIQIVAVLGSVANMAPWGSLQRAIIFYAVVLCIEDFTRTWFVASRVGKGLPVALASLAFAIAISFVEFVAEISDLTLVAANNAFGVATGRSVEAYDLFFSSYSSPLAMIIFDLTRPIDHFLLCLSMYYAWRLRNWITYSSLVISHIALDVIIDITWNRDPPNSYVPILGVSLLFTLLWCLATLWIRATAKRRSVEPAQNVGTM